MVRGGGSGGAGGGETTVIPEFLFSNSILSTLTKLTIFFTSPSVWNGRSKHTRPWNKLFYIMLSTSKNQVLAYRSHKNW